MIPVSSISQGRPQSEQIPRFPLAAAGTDGLAGAAAAAAIVIVMGIVAAEAGEQQDPDQAVAGAAATIVTIQDQQENQNPPHGITAAEVTKATHCIASFNLHVFIRHPVSILYHTWIAPFLCLSCHP